MSNFKDILDAPLPSKTSAFVEGSDGADFDVDSELASLTEACKTEACGTKDEGCESEGCKTEEGDMSELASLLAADPNDDAADPGEEEEIDSQLADLEGLMSVNTDDGDEEDGEEEEACKSEECETKNEGCKTEEEEDIPVDPTMASSVDDPTPAPPLEGEADKDADSMMAIVATPMILDDALTEEEARDFIESGDADIAVSEDLMLESALDDMVSNLFDGVSQAYTESVFASPNRPYKMTKKARLNQLYELSLQIEARAHHDPYVPRIEKAYKIERQIKAGWRKRYGALAMKRAKKYLKKLMNSKSSGLKKAAKRLVNK